MPNWMFVVATSGQNLFDEKWTQGNLYEIQPIVNVLSTVAVWVISIVGFGIVIFSILKNAMSGLYVVNPTFWDKVSDVKNQAVAGASNAIQSAAGRVPGGGSAITQRIGGVMTFLLGLIPDIRALTDFDDGVPIDKKQYFMKSIPLLVFQIFIGMFIFFGYPSKIANWIGSGGTYVVDAIINNTDPVAIVQGISDKITVYQLATDGSPLPFDQNVNKGASEMIRTVQSRYTDMQKEPTQETAYALESFLQTALSKGGAESVLGAEEGYEVNIVTSYNSGIPNIAEAFKYVSQDPSYPLVRAQATNGTVQYKTWVAAQSLPTGSTKVGENDYFVWTITATPVSVSKTSSASLIMCAGYVPTGTVGSGNNVSIRVNGITIGSGSRDLHGTPGAVSIDVMQVSSGSAVVTASTSAKLETTSVNITENASAVLVFTKAQWDSISSYMSDPNSYLRVSLSGSWSMDVPKPGAANTSFTSTVSEIRLKANATTLSYGVNIWSDFSLADYSTSFYDAYSALESQSKAGSTTP